MQVTADCVTVTITGLSPVIVTVIFAIRVLPVVLAEKVAEMVPLPAPKGVTVHQVWLLATFHSHAKGEVTMKEVNPAVFETI